MRALLRALQLAGSLALFATATCSLDGSLGPVTSIEFRSAQARWNRQDVEDYDFDYLRSCFCEHVEEVRVRVRNGVVESAVYTRDDSPVPPSVVATLPTIPDLFEIVREALEDADEVNVEYDPTYGHPARVDIDWLKDAIDDEVLYRVEELTPVP